jgi:hypothetical protein
MDLLDNEIKARQEIFGYFGYAENWRVLPFDDARDYYWRIAGGDLGSVCFAETELDLARAGGESELARKITAKWPDQPTTRQAVHQWKICPRRRRAQMLELTGVDLRPDLE